MPQFEYNLDTKYVLPIILNKTQVKILYAPQILPIKPKPSQRLPYMLLAQIQQKYRKT